MVECNEVDLLTAHVKFWGISISYFILLYHTWEDNITLFTALQLSDSYSSHNTHKIQYMIYK